MANKKKPFYTKKTLLLFRLFALIAIVILITSFIYTKSRNWTMNFQNNEFAVY